MTANSPSAAPLLPPKRQRSRVARLALLVGALLTIYLLVAYLVVPMLWRHYEHQPEAEGFPKTTETGSHIPGDPLNIGLVATEQEAVSGMLEAGWVPADPTTIRSSVHIAESVLLNRPYPKAPVSNLFLFGRKQDLAFEKPDGESAKRRHHVRFWKAESHGPQGKPLWLGAATFDLKVGVSHRTGQITHHIAPNVDAERNEVLADLQAVGQLTTVYQVTGVGLTLVGRNGGGDPYFTDGELSIGVIADDNKKQTVAPKTLDNPPLVDLKNEAWSWLLPLVQTGMPTSLDATVKPAQPVAH